jgi:hypothetical protein
MSSYLIVISLQEDKQVYESLFDYISLPSKPLNYFSDHILLVLLLCCILL